MMHERNKFHPAFCHWIALGLQIYMCTELFTLVLFMQLECLINAPDFLKHFLAVA